MGEWSGWGGVSGARGVEDPIILAPVQRGCGTWFAQLYFASFVVVVSLVFLNLFVAVILGLLRPYCQLHQKELMSA